MCSKIEIDFVFTLGYFGFKMVLNLYIKASTVYRELKSVVNSYRLCLGSLMIFKIDKLYWRTRIYLFTHIIIYSNK
ncbi:hypothetical protein SDC9_94805 [bioreactor metagenome]|uniref:Uncharacterized protein n=1 Tax=bioreactor metagenome TaxID=1076179 RepID=A0A645AB78_9ZZZZ